jgi:hypothetical protein
MNIRLKCSCGARFTTSEELRGNMVRCPKCRKALRVPETAPAGGGEEVVAFVTDDQAAESATVPARASTSSSPVRATVKSTHAAVAIAPADTTWQSRPAERETPAARRGGAWKWLLLILLFLIPASVVGTLVILPYFQPKDPREVVAQRYLDALRRDDLAEAGRLSVIVAEHPRNITGVEQVGLAAGDPRAIRGKFFGLRRFHDEINQQYTWNAERGRFMPKDELGLGLNALSAVEGIKKKAQEQAAANAADPARQKKTPEERDLDDVIGSLGAFSEIAKQAGGFLSTGTLGPTYTDLLKKTTVTLTDAERSLAEHYARDPAKWQRLLGREFLDLPDLGEFELQEAEIVATIRTAGQSLGEPGRPIKLRLVRFSMGSIDTGWRVWQAE